MNKLLRLNDVKDRISLKRSTIYSLVKQGLFPEQIRLSKRAVGWIEQDILAWMACKECGVSDDKLRAVVAKLNEKHGGQNE